MYDKHTLHVRDMRGALPFLGGLVGLLAAKVLTIEAHALPFVALVIFVLMMLGFIAWNGLVTEDWRRRHHRAAYWIFALSLTVSGFVAEQFIDRYLSLLGTRTEQTNRLRYRGLLWRRIDAGKAVGDSLSYWAVYDPGDSARRMIGRRIVAWRDTTVDSLRVLDPAGASEFADIAKAPTVYPQLSDGPPTWQEAEYFDPHMVWLRSRAGALSPVDSLDRPPASTAWKHMQ